MKIYIVESEDMFGNKINFVVVGNYGLVLIKTNIKYLSDEDEILKNKMVLYFKKETMINPFRIIEEIEIPNLIYERIINKETRFLKNDVRDSVNVFCGSLSFKEKLSNDDLIKLILNEKNYICLKCKFDFKKGYQGKMSFCPICGNKLEKEIFVFSTGTILLYEEMNLHGV